MSFDLSRIQQSFEIVSTNPVRRAGDGNFMQILRELNDQFSSAQQKMSPVTGLPGVFTPNPTPPQTAETLGITSAPLDTAS